MPAHDANEPVFNFLRARQRFVEHQAETEGIDGFVVWAASVDALGRIHAGRLGANRNRVRRCFTAALQDLAIGRGLDRVSVPLLHHDLVFVAPCLREHPAFEAYRKARSVSRFWSYLDDGACASGIHDFRNLCNGNADVMKTIRNNTYADILYIEYRCCAVHGLELGRKTCNPFDGRAEPHYMNYSYLADDPRPPEHRYKTRIVFPLAFLAAVLAEIINAEAAQCSSAGYVVPPYPTLTQ